MSRQPINKSSPLPPASYSSRDNGLCLTRREKRLEQALLFHIIVLLTGTAWAYGGNVDWAKTLVGIWGTLALPLLGLLVADHQQRCSSYPKALLTLWPFVAFNALIITSLFFAGFRVGYYEGEALLINNQVSPLIPSSAQPPVSLRALWLFDAIYLSCFNLLLGIKTRHSFRLLLFTFSTNAIVLAVFGTLQKLVRSDGLYFGAQPSPQPKFFSTFIYHNHWGAFTTMMVALGLGIVFHYYRRKEGSSILKTPAVLVGTSVLFLAISVPLSGSRSSTLMVGALLLIAFSNWLLSTCKRYQRQRKNPLFPILFACAIFIVLIGSSYKLGEPVIRERLMETREQLSDRDSQTGFGSRPILYRDTWRMASDRHLFGWGMGSYPVIFPLYNTSDISPIDGLPKNFHDAHSDWLQSLAEVGIVGTALLILCAVVPLVRYRHSLLHSPISTYLLLGLLLVLLYASIEFPFGNTAVIIAFWVCFFTALSYGRIESNRAG